jgi:outer membrane protein OmpA-like peptidoglycan-associated protein/uncharacterized protein YidB (DUF937 family)
MGTLNFVLQQVQERFGISSSSAASLLSGLVSYINSQGGGLSGFLERFQRAGLGDVVSSWLGSESVPKTITPDALQDVVGRDTIANIASKAGVPATAASSVLAFVLPTLIQKLTPGGAIPSRLPTDISSILGSGASSVMAGAKEAVAATERSGIWRLVWPIAAAIILGIIGLAIWRGVGAKFDPQEQVRLADEKATAALAALKPGFAPQDLVRALNLYVINFDTGSAEIPAYSTAFLSQAAKTIHGSLVGTVIEIDGHTDNTGDETSNMALSQQRADAVRNYLVQHGVDPDTLVAKGFGSSKPVAPNDTEEGKFRNRRIEFVVLR